MSAQAVTSRMLKCLGSRKVSLANIAATDNADFHRDICFIRYTDDGEYFFKERFIDGFEFRQQAKN